MNWKREIKGFVDGLHEMKRFWSVMVAPLPLVGFIALLIAIRSPELLLSSAPYLILIGFVFLVLLIVEDKNL